MDQDSPINTSLAKKERLKSLLTSSDLADCSFIVEGDEIKAHKLILTCSSPVFEKIFYGELASDQVVITDITKDDFRQMLEFVYTDNVIIASVAHAWSLFYIADKYLLNDFSDVCVTYIEKNLNIGNLVLNYEYAEMYSLRELQNKCMYDISDYVQGIFQKDCSDYHMKSTTLLEILQQQALNIGNTDLVVGVLQWAITECEIKNVLEITPKTILDLLESQDILKLLINLKFDIDTNCNNINITKTLEMLKKSRNPLVPYKEYLKKHWCTFCKTRQTYKISRRIELRSSDCLLSNISVNRNAVLYGLVLITEDEQVGCVSSTYEGTLTIHINAVGDTASVKTTSVTKTFPYENHVYVPLKELVLLESDRTYCIRIGYVNLGLTSKSSVRKSSVLCNYMSSKLVDEKRKTIFSFDDLYELGSVIKGICYYPA